jgi:hypothetical protein
MPNCHPISWSDAGCSKSRIAKKEAVVSFAAVAGPVVDCHKADYVDLRQT